MMMTLMEDIRLAVRQMMRSSEMVTTVLPLLVLGIALNVGVLHVVDALRMEMGEQQMTRAACEMSSPAQRMVASFQKMMDGGQHRGCAKSWVQERQAQVVRYSAEAKQMVYCALGQKSMC
jgi:hypothetical protein